MTQKVVILPTGQYMNAALGEYGEYEPDDDNSGNPAPVDIGSPEAARYDGRGGNRDPCAGVFCPEIDCPTRPYIPEGECCPVCPGQSPAAPHLQVIYYIGTSIH